MSDELLRELPRDLPSFLKRFGTDAECRAYLVRARWPEGFRCSGCGHREAWSHKQRLIEECRSCGKQHSILAGTMFEQTKTGLSKWFLAIYLVTSSKGGISAMELQRQMGFGSYGTAWSWLHKIRRAMIRPDREPLQNRVEVDETLVGGARSGKTGRGADGKTVVVGAVEAGTGKGRKRPLGRLRLATIADASAKSLEGFIAADTAKPLTVNTDGWSGYHGLEAKGYAHEAINLSQTPSRPAGRACFADRIDGLLAIDGRRLTTPARHPPRLQPGQTLAARHPPRRRPAQAPAALPRRVRLPLQPPESQGHQPRLRSADPARRHDTAHHLPWHRAWRGRLRVTER
jgi:transposase-like protein